MISSVKNGEKWNIFSMVREGWQYRRCFGLHENIFRAVKNFLLTDSLAWYPVVTVKSIIGGCINLGKN